MHDQQLCFTCAFWMDKILNHNICNQIINGELLVFNPYTTSKPSHITFTDNKTVYIQLTDGTVMRSNDIWSQGMVPEQFRSQLPDSAVYITKQAYFNINKHPFFQCHSKGCWDRYHCHWYDPNQEVDGPWNEIPTSHKTGDECCESFLDKTKVYV